MAHAKKAKSTKGWKKLAPKTRSSRRALLAHCGVKAFLQPRAKPAPKYPITGKGEGCAPDCRALRAAKARAEQHGHSHIAAKAYILAKRAGCSWVK